MCRKDGVSFYNGQGHGQADYDHCLGRGKKALGAILRRHFIEFLPALDRCKTDQICTVGAAEFDHP